MGLGDVVEAALSKIGLTKERVESWVGGPCGCRERQEKLNALGNWAWRVVRGRDPAPSDSLSGMMGASPE
jgi:hypothetical protein